MKYTIVPLVLMFLGGISSCHRDAAVSSADSPRRPVEWVKPVIDTVQPRWIFFSSACRPFGMVNLSPDTATKGDWGAGYRYEDKTIRSFSHIHDWQLAGLAVMPVAGDCNGHLGMDQYQSAFSHEDEIVQAGYHKVVLQKYGIVAELTSTTRVGFHRYQFNSGQAGRVLIDTSSPLMDCSMIDSRAQVDADKRQVEGFVTLSKTVRRPKPVNVYFVIQFNRPFTAFGGWKDGKLLDGQPTEIIGPNAGQFVDFAPSDQPVLMKVALSYTSIEGARRNLNTELPHWDFDRIRRESADDWNAWLGRIEVQGGTDDQKTKFYTDLWHALLGRRIVSDVDGSYMDNTGPSPIIRKVTPTASGQLLPHYGFDAWWGSHWNLNILWPMAWPEVTDGFCQTMVDMYRNGGLIPRGPSGGNYTFVMNGDTAMPFLASAYHLGVRSWDIQKAYEGLRKNAFPGGIRDRAGYEHDAKASGGGIAYYVERGYIPEGIPGKGYHRNGAAMTLEYAYQDWCLGQLARSLGKDQDAELFIKRSQNYRNLWNPETSWMHPRTMDGGWIPDFAPIGKGGNTKGFTESNSAIYTYFVPHDTQGLIALFGGAESFTERLDEQFRKARPARFITPHGKHAEGWTDYENQPGLGMAFWFNHAGKPWLTQQWVRQVHQEIFSDVTPYGGYNGDEDQGQIGAFSALNAIGLFALDGCASMNPQYEITCPMFEKITIHLDPKYHPGKTFVITVRNGSQENVYIQSAKLNGKTLHSFQFPCSMLTAGGTLDIVAGPNPNQQWGVPAR